ncbi:MAG TPA: 3-hydroxyisobutyrate dehydrogenase [Gammaproteobacteria bacterium]|nr:3-hydroxyisobutyrate dehydrogenase [Gammaproteobacteria bacterium]
MSHIAFIGLGHMGQPMAQNLLKQGHQVTAYDTVADRITPLTALGATAATSVLDAIKSANIIITMLQTGEQVSSVCLGNNGIFAHAKPGSLYIDCSSIDITSSRMLHEAAVAAGLAMVDAPVSGGDKGAAAATLTFMVGGTEANFQRAEEVLKAMGKKIFHAGPPGNGQAAKICNNMILGVSMIAVSEAFNLAEKLGLPADKFFEICSNASGQCWSLTTYAPVPEVVPTSPANFNYEPGFTGKMMLKDLLLSQNAAQQSGNATPLGAAATALYTLFVNQGYGEKDFSGIIQMLSGKAAEEF